MDQGISVLFLLINAIHQISEAIQYFAEIRNDTLLKRHIYCIDYYY